MVHWSKVLPYCDLIAEMGMVYSFAPVAWLGHLSATHSSLRERCHGGVDPYFKKPRWLVTRSGAYSVPIQNIIPYTFGYGLVLLLQRVSAHLTGQGGVRRTTHKSPSLNCNPVNYRTHLNYSPYHTVLPPSVKKQRMGYRSGAIHPSNEQIRLIL